MDSSASPQKRSLTRSWNRLSRLQRSIIYFLSVIMVLTVVYFAWTNDEKPLKIVTVTEDELPHEDDGGVLAQPLSQVEEEPKNRVEIVQRVIENNKPIVDHNKAEEDLDYEDEKMYEGNEPGAARLNEDNSNQGAEDLDTINKEHDLPKPSLVLPPKDGSLVFRGPTNQRQKAVVDAFKHAWKGYKTYAWGHDHLRPISKGAQNWFGLGLTLIDSLDTMYVMNLRDEFDEAKDWVAEHLNFSINKDVNLFETTIRVLGGLLSAFHLSAERIFLDKAKDLGQRLMGAFTSASGIPYSDVNLKSTRGHAPKWSPDSSTSEVTTLQLEFRDLGRCIDEDSNFEEAAAKISNIIHKLDKTEGLVPIFINANSGKFRKHSTITFGARGDSYYEYLLKQWIQTGKSIDFLKEDFLEAMKGVANRLAKRTVPNRLLYIGEIISGGKDFKPKMDELACFLPGTLALASYHGLKLSGKLPPKNANNEESVFEENLLLTLAEELAYTCYLTFEKQPTFLAPEITHFNSEPSSTNDFYVKPADSHYLLRPETIESLWYLYYVTGNKTYQEWGWKIFQGIENYTKVLNGYTTIGNVRNALDMRPKDMMESFFLGETLKYLYLLFADKQEFDLKQWVFNTEAHPLPVHPN